MKKSVLKVELGPAAGGGVVSRRHFLRSTAFAAGAAPLVLPSGLLAAAPNSKLNHACIGMHGMGVGDRKSFLKHPRLQIVAICDVDANHLKDGLTDIPQARTYADWRELLDQEGDKIDSVNVTVPDHMHFPIAYSAIQKGKHVYCQKPLCHDLAEVRELTRAAERQGVITQLGTQMASGVGDRMTVQMLRAGVVGKVKHVYLTANRPGAVEAYRALGPRPATSQPPPAELKWDLWLGTAPTRPYVSGLYHPVKWRAWLDFGTGWSGDIGCHVFDAVWKGLRLKAPLSATARVQESWKNSPERRADTWPQANHITWMFPGSELTDSRELPVEWFDGEFYPDREVRALFAAEEYPPESAMVVGTEGALLLILGRTPLLLPEDKFKNFQRPKLPNRDHYLHFVDACLGGEKTESHFTQTGPMTEAILLGTVAVRLPGQRLEWDPRALKVPNVPEAQRYLQRTYREGWQIPGIG
jgi:predicted dehydrogenase